MEKNQAPLQISLAENKFVVTGYYAQTNAQKTGIQTGDIITGIDGKPAAERAETIAPYSPASNPSAKMRTICFNLLRTNQPNIQLEVLRNGKVLHFNTHTVPYNPDEVKRRYMPKEKSFEIIKGNIGYINHSSLKKTDIPEIAQQLGKTKALIIDCRNYPSDFPIFALSEMLLPKKTVFAKLFAPSIKTPGVFTEMPPQTAGKDNPNHYKGKVIILVNAMTQSAAEFSVMAYKMHPDAIIIGSETAGADGDVSKLPLPGNILTGFTGLGVYRKWKSCSVLVSFRI